MRYLEFADREAMRRVERAVSTAYFAANPALADRTVAGVPVARITTTAMATRQHPDFAGGVLQVPDELVPLVLAAPAADPAIAPQDVLLRTLAEVTPAVRDRLGLSVTTVISVSASEVAADA